MPKRLADFPQRPLHDPFNQIGARMSSMKLIPKERLALRRCGGCRPRPPASPASSKSADWPCAGWLAIQLALSLDETGAITALRRSGWLAGSKAFIDQWLQDRGQFGSGVGTNGRCHFRMLSQIELIRCKEPVEQ